MTLASAASHYAERGLAVLPLREGGKEPLVEHGVHDATPNADVVARWWRRWPRANVGIAVPGEWFVLDVDPRNGGEMMLESLELKHGALPSTVVQRTGSGGAHLLFARPRGGVRLRGKIGAGLDILGIGRYFVAQPSTHPCGGSYRWTAPKGTAIAQPPTWLVDLVVQESAPPARPSPPVTSCDSRVERARRYLQKCDPAISGSHGHDQTFVVAQKLTRGFDLDDQTALSLLMSEWNLRCEPPWSERDLRRKVAQAARFGRMPVGALLEAS